MFKIVNLSNCFIKIYSIINKSIYTYSFNIIAFLEMLKNVKKFINGFL